MKKKMYGEIQENLSIAQSPSLAILRFFLLQAGGWAVIGSAVQSFSQSIANQSPWEYALQGLTPPGFSAHRPVRQVHLRSFWIAKIQRRRNSMSAANKAIIRRLYEEVWNQRKLELINEIISPSHALQAPNVGGTAVGPEAYKRQVLRLLAGYPDLRWTIEDLIAEEDKVVACWSMSGTHKGEYLGVPATNKNVSVDGITIHHITNGKIMDSYSNYDALGMMQQLGVVPAIGDLKGATAR